MFRDNWTVTYYDYRDGGTYELTVPARHADQAGDKVRDHLIANDGAEPDDIWITAANIEGNDPDIR